MIHPTQLTKEAGFEEGVVVMVKEVQWRERPMVLRIGRNEHGEYITDAHAYAYFSHIESIRPLTGPMSIWNFAPKWAESCIAGRNGVYWIQGSRPEDSDWPDLGWEKITFRPWWAK